MDAFDLLKAFASAFQQDNRHLKLDFADNWAAPPELLPQSLTGTSELNNSYRYELDCLSVSVQLDLKRLLGVPVQIRISTADGGEQRISGVVSGVSAKGSDGGFARYQLVVEPPLALLRHRITSRVFQDKSVVEIVQQIIQEHQSNNPVMAASLELAISLHQNYASRSYCSQYQESDFVFIQRLLFEEGISYVFTHQGEPSAPLVRWQLFDDPYQLPQSPLESVSYHRADATESSDALTQWEASRQIIPSQVDMASFDYQQPTPQVNHYSSEIDNGSTADKLQSTLTHYRLPGAYYASDLDDAGRYVRLRQQALNRQAKTFVGEGTLRGLQVGEWFELDNHPAHLRDSQTDRQFVVTQHELTARNNLPEGLAALLPTGLKQADSDNSPFRLSFQAQRRHLPLLAAYSDTGHAKPTAPGPQTAIVVGPAGEEVYCDAQGRIKIQLHWQRPDEHPGTGAVLDDNSSTWVRVAMPAAGAAWGHQFIPRIGQEVVVNFINGDIDRPLVTGVVYNGSHLPPTFSDSGNLPANKTLSGFKSKEHGSSGYNELLFDDTTGQLRTRLSSEHGKTQLNQGYLTHPRQDGKADPRGEGFELRTDLSGALRAAEGLLLTAYDQRGAKGTQLDRKELLSQLEMALSIAQTLAKQAETHQADTTDTEPQQQLVTNVKQWEIGSNTAKGDSSAPKGIVAMTAPQGIALASEADITLATNSNHDQVVAKDSNHSVGQSLRLRIGQSLSIFVRQMGMKLIAAAGKISIQAQNDDVEIGAAKNLHLYALESILIDAPNITLRGKNGAIQLGNGITTSTTATHTQHAAQHVLDGGASVSGQTPVMPQSTQQYNEQFAVAGRSGTAQGQINHDVTNGQGQNEGGGSTDGTGATSSLAGKAIDSLTLSLKRSS